MTTPMSPQGIRSRETLFLLLIVLGGAFLRFDRLGAQSLWIDEFLMIQRASLGEPFRWADWFANPQGPLPALLLRLWTGAAGTSEASLRFLSALFGTATIPVIWRLARRLDPAAGLPAALLAALSPFLVWYSQETRHYALALLAAAWLADAALRLEDDASRRAWVSYALALLVGLMSHLGFVFVAAAHGLALLARRRDLLRPWCVAVVPVFLLLSPWLWVALARNVNLAHVTSAGPIPAAEQLRGESTFSWAGIPYTAFVFLAGYSLGPTLRELHDAPRLATVVPYLGVILPLFAGGVLLLAAALPALRRRPFRLTLVGLWFLVPLGAVILLSMRNAKVFHPRYMAAAVPLLLAVTALGWIGLRGRAPRLVAGLLLLGPLLVSLHQYRTDPRYGREDTRGAAAILNRQARADDLVLGVGAPQLLEWYGHGAAPLQMVFDVWIRDREGLERRVDEWAVGRRRIWLVQVRPWLQDPDGRLAAILDRRYGPARDEELSGVRLRRYDVATGGAR